MPNSVTSITFTFTATVIPFDFYTEITPEEASIFTSITTAISLIIALVVVSSIAAFTYYYKVMSAYISLNYTATTLCALKCLHFVLPERSDEESLRDQSQRGRDQRYSVRGQSQQTLSCDSVTFKTDSTGISLLYYQKTKLSYIYVLVIFFKNIWMKFVHTRLSNSPNNRKVKARLVVIFTVVRIIRLEGHSCITNRKHQHRKRIILFKCVHIFFYFVFVIYG